MSETTIVPRPTGTVGSAQGYQINHLGHKPYEKHEKVKGSGHWPGKHRKKLVLYCYYIIDLFFEILSLTYWRVLMHGYQHRLRAIFPYRHRFFVIFPYRYRLSIIIMRPMCIFFIGIGYRLKQYFYDLSESVID